MPDAPSSYVVITRRASARRGICFCPPPLTNHRTCHPERARRASRRTPIVEAISDPRLDYFRGPTPTGIAGLHVRVSMASYQGTASAVPDAPSSYVVITRRASARRGICFCQPPLTNHPRVILSEPAGRVEGPLSWKQSAIRGRPPAGTAGLQARVSIGLVTGHGFSRAGCAFFLCCHHEEGFSPTRDLLLPATAHQLRRVILSEPAGRVEGPLSWKRSTIRGWTIFAGAPRLVLRAFRPASASASYQGTASQFAEKLDDCVISGRASL